MNSGLVISVSIPHINETITLMLSTKDGFCPSEQMNYLLYSSITMIRFFELGKINVADIQVSSTDHAHAIMMIMCQFSSSFHYSLIDKVMPMCRPSEICQTYGGLMEELIINSDSEYIFQAYLDYHCVSKSDLLRIIEVYPMSEKLVRMYQCLDPKLQDHSYTYHLMEQKVQACFKSMMLWNSYKMANMLV
jgi:hypothetical protein